LYVLKSKKYVSVFTQRSGETFKLDENRISFA